MRPGRAEVGRGPAALFSTAKELHLDGSGKILTQLHTFNRLTVKHESVVTQGPARPAFHLLSHEPVDRTDPVIGILRLIEEVPEDLLEFIPLVIADRKKPILDPEGIPVVLTCLMPHELGGPTLQILPVEEADPVLPSLPGALLLFKGLTRFFLFSPGQTGHHESSRAEHQLQEVSHLHGLRVTTHLPSRQSSFGPAKDPLLITHASLDGPGKFSGTPQFHSYSAEPLSYHRV